MYKRLGAIVLLLSCVAVAGYWLGVQTAPTFPKEPELKPLPKPTTPADIAQGEQSPAVVVNPPLYFMANTGPQADRALVLDQVRMAVDAGIKRFVVTSDLPWDGTTVATDRLLEVVASIAKISPECDVLVQLNLNPPESWLAQYPDERIQSSGQPLEYVSLSSEVWLRDLDTAFTVYVEQLSKSDYRRLVSGGILSALERGFWYRNGYYDRSPANILGFRRWLQRTYKTDDALRTAWQDSAVTLATASIPIQPSGQDAKNVFFLLPEMQRNVDYLRFVSVQTADVLTHLVSQVKSLAGDQVQVLIPYGFGYELTENATGHFALETLLHTPVDGFVSPVSFVDRGLGGVGGFMGPVDSAAAHGKSWTVLDDTRTGIEKDPANGTVARMQGIRAEDVYNVQRRNFTAALVHNLGVFWSDSNGLGTLHDPEAWKNFGAMKDIYARIGSGSPQPHPHDIRPSEHVTLCVVVDEESRFVQACDVLVNERLLIAGRDAALRSGVATQFSLLNDVIAESVPPADVYLFLNAFHLSEQQRIALHEKLKRESATAIWMYAPGYFSEGGANVANISLTTGMQVSRIDAASTTGSVVQFTGQLLAQQTELGPSTEWAPLFSISESVDVIANYRMTGQPSIAVKSGDLGWTSIYVADPYIDAAMLREFLSLLEVPLRVTRDRSGEQRYDTVHFGTNLMAIHADGEGVRTIELTWPYSVSDLFNTEIGWQQKHQFNMTMQAGQTALLELTPSADLGTSEAETSVGNAVESEKGEAP